tara:strand:- start:251 stop:835 length:585 start_codon:yes stop_codon:yes gene_type:complete
MINKKGLSAVIATLLILMLTVVIVVILSAVAIPFVRDNLYSSTECVEFNDAFKFDEDQPFNCFTPDGSNLLSISTTLNNDTYSKIRGFSLVFSGSGSSQSFQFKKGEDPGGALGMLDQDTSGNDCINQNPDYINSEFPGRGELRTYIYLSGAEKFNKAEIGPTIFSEKTQKERSCEAVDSIKLIECADSPPICP